MNCDQASLLLDSYVDGEFVDVVRVRELEAHLETCPKCRQELDALQKVRKLVREQATYFRAPDQLVLNIEAIGRPELKPAKPTFNWRKLLWPTFAFSGFAVAALVLVIFFINRGQPPSMESEVIAGYIRSLQANHLYDVVSTDKHTVKPWFQGKVNFAPEVPNLESDGFPLLGGRLDYVNRHPAAALVYRHAKHVINVFVMPGAECSANPTPSSQDGYHIVSWSEHDLQYWAVSDMDTSTLVQFSESFIGATR